MKAYFEIKGLKEFEKAVEKAADPKHLGKKIRSAWQTQAAVTQVKVRSHAKTRLGGSGKLSKSYRVKVYGFLTHKLEMLLYSYVDATLPHEYGPMAPISALLKRFLAIPTEFAAGRVMSRRRLKSGSLVRAGKRVTPRMLKKDTTFVITNKHGRKVIMQKVEEGSRPMKRAKKAYGKKFSASVLPMFTLVKRVVLPVRTNVRRVFKYQLKPIEKATLDTIERVLLS